MAVISPCFNGWDEHHGAESEAGREAVTTLEWGIPTRATEDLCYGFQESASPDARGRTASR